MKRKYFTALSRCSAIAIFLVPVLTMAQNPLPPEQAPCSSLACDEAPAPEPCSSLSCEEALGPQGPEAPCTSLSCDEAPGPQGPECSSLACDEALGPQGPSDLTLRGNYPNPFNPTTNVTFDLGEDATVVVAVYDLRGRRVMTTSQQFFEAGENHQVRMDASALATGSYVYHVIGVTGTATLSQTGRMLLLK